ncbi:MAG: response regulator [Elusimicrobia bacterium]|nr:response regulator [Elusimicrobiota bacterium]
MAIAAFLGRENPRFIHPQILWSFLGLLAFNLLNFAWLTRRLSAERRIPLAIVSNILLISLILRYSGGAHSYFWVIYLQPIFAACLSLKRKGILATAGATLVVLGAFYANALARLIWPDILELLIKAFTLLISAGVTMRMAFNERRALLLLQAEQARAALERQQAREQVQHMDRLATLGTLSAGIAHELNSPLATILGFAQCALLEDPKPQSLADSLKRIESGALRCKQTIQGLLAFARRQKNERRPAEVNALLHECVGIKKFDWIAGNIRTEELYSPDLPLLPLCGPEFQQVIFNLITNAEQAIRSKPEAKGLIRIRTESDPEHLRIFIEDDGPGIRPELQERIFEPFFTTKPAGKGTGLGLSISRQIIQDQGGKLSLSSAQGQGATFLIEFPVPKEAAADRAPPARAGAAGKILVAENDASVRPLLSKLLSRYGRPVGFAGTFDEALRAIQEDPPALLIMDMNMPGMSALEFLTRLESEGRLAQLKILPISGSSPGEALAAFLDRKGLRVIEKPFDINEFQSRVGNMLRGVEADAS